MKAKRFRLNNDLTIIKLKLNIKSGFHCKNQKFLKSFFFLLYIALAFISPTYSFSTEKEFPLKTPDSSAVIYVAPTTFIYEAVQNDVNISDVIYVAPGTTIFGTLSAQEISIPKLPKAVEKKTTTSDMRNALGLSKEFVPQKKIKNKIVQRFQDQLNLDVKNTIYSAPLKLTFNNWLDFFREFKSNSLNTKNILYCKTVGMLISLEYFFSKTLYSTSSTSNILIKLLKADNLSLKSPPLLYLF